MPHLALPFPSLLVIRTAVAAVWLYEGLWCKIFARAPQEAQVVSAVHWIPTSVGSLLLKLLGLAEVILAAWVMWGAAPGVCALAETALLVVLNFNGLVWARRLIPDPAGMVLKNAAFLVLVWICGAIPGAQP